MNDVQNNTEMGEDDNEGMQWKPKIGMVFDSEPSAFDFYNNYGGKIGFSVRRGCFNKDKSGEFTSRTFFCAKEGNRPSDKRDYLVKNPRAETRTGCGALMMLASQISGLQLHKECVVVNDGRDKECVVVNENIIKAKGIKKKPVTCRRKRRIKSSLEKAMASARKRKQSQSHEGLQMPPNMLPYLLSECGPGFEALLQGGTSNSSRAQCSNSLIAGTSNAEQFGYMPSANHFGQW